MTMYREVTLASLHLEHPRWLNPRTFTGLDDDSLHEFGKELKERGVLDPPTVQKVTFGGQVIDLVIDGQRRVRAALGALPKSTKIHVVDRTEKPIELTWDESDEIMLEVLSMASHREGLSSYELSEVAERMRIRERKLSEIAKAVGRDESWVSKILKARATASPKLMLAWRKGQVTDEQFKELALVKDPAKQAEVTKEVAATRETGDKAEARIRVKELAEQYKQDEKKLSKTKTNGHAVVVTPANGGHQAEMWSPPPPVVAKKATVPRHVLEELVALADKRAPTHDYVKGLMDGVRYALGEIDADEFGKPWRAYLERVGGSGKAPKKVTKKKASKAKSKKRR
jgi:ParB-like chromosome segregation protein Spo0J